MRNGEDLTIEYVPAAIEDHDLVPVTNGGDGPEIEHYVVWGNPPPFRAPELDE